MTHEPWCNAEEHPQGRCLRIVGRDSAVATFLGPPAEPAPTTLTVDVAGSRVIRVSGDRGDVLCLTHCGPHADVEGLRRDAGRLADVLGCQVAIFAGEIVPAALPAEANLGIATTVELLDELRARLDVSGVVGETPRGDYRTSTGEPVGEPAAVVSPLDAAAAALDAWTPPPGTQTVAPTTQEAS